MHTAISLNYIIILAREFLSSLLGRVERNRARVYDTSDTNAVPVEVNAFNTLDISARLRVQTDKIETYY